MCAPFPQKYKVSFGVPGFAISQYHTATNPYFAISKSKTALEMVFLSNCQKDTLAIIYNDGFNNVLINSGVDQVRKLVKADKMAFIVFGFDRQNGTYCVIHL